MNRKLLLAPVIIILLLALGGCAKEQSRTVLAMDTVMSLEIYGGSQNVLDLAQARIQELEGLLSVTDEGSEIYALNTQGSAGLSEDTQRLIAGALELCDLTSGALDISIYPLVRAWGFTTGQYRIPEAEEIAGLLPLVSYKGVTLSGNRASLEQGMEIDLGGVAKGYTGDVLAALLKENGVKSAILNLGGNVHALGKKPDGQPWRVAIQDPYGQGRLGVVELVDAACVTSGGYERCFTGEDGNVYWHIIDPATGYSAHSGLISVTVIGQRGLVCDGLSTALFVMGAEKAEELWQRDGSFDYIMLGEDGTIYITPGVADSFEPDEAYAQNPIVVAGKEGGTQ